MSKLEILKLIHYWWRGSEGEEEEDDREGGKEKQKGLGLDYVLDPFLLFHE